MRVLHLASTNRWTGAAAPAFAEVEALRGAGIEAHYAYVGGYKLEARIGHHPFAHALIERAQNPVSFARTSRRLRALVDRYGFDLLHAHLTWDHALALAARRSGTRVARTFHSRRTLRRDPFTRALVRRTSHLFAINEKFLGDGPLRDRTALFTPPPVDHRFFRSDGPDVRDRYAIPRSSKVIAVIGKLAPGRGFELALESFTRLRRTIAGSRLLVIGHGPHRPALEEHARVLGIAESVVWAGYHEDDLPEHYRAADALFFTAAGSDEGHRAILEAMACGVPPVSAPIEGVAALLGRCAERLIAPAPEAEAIARCAATLLSGEEGPVRRSVEELSRAFGYEHAAQRLLDGYALVGARG